MRKIIIAVGIALVATGCAVPVQSPTVTVTAPAAAPATSTAPADPTPEATRDNRDAIDMLFSLTWDQLSSDDHEAACLGWNVDPELMTETFMEGITNDTYSNAELKAGLRRLMAREC